MYSYQEITKLKQMSIKEYFLDRVKLYFRPLSCCFKNYYKHTEPCCVINLLSDHIIQTLENSKDSQLNKNNFRKNNLQNQSDAVYRLSLIDDHTIKILKGRLLVQ